MGISIMLRQEGLRGPLFSTESAGAAADAYRLVLVLALLALLAPLLPARYKEKGVVGIFTSGDFVATRTGPEGVTNDSTGTFASNKVARAIGSNGLFIMLMFFILLRSNVALRSPMLVDYEFKVVKNKLNPSKLHRKSRWQAKHQLENGKTVTLNLDESKDRDTSSIRGNETIRHVLYVPAKITDVPTTIWTIHIHDQHHQHRIEPAIKIIRKNKVQ
jgi:hypothetical protein